MVVTTPPPPSSVARTPPTPRHGPMLDDYEPYSPRHTARISNQRVHRSKHSISTQAVSPPASNLDLTPEPAPSVSTDGDTIMSDLGRRTFSPSRTDGGHLEHGPAAAAMMLPTPAKTPRKTIEWSAPALRPTARLLFANRMNDDEEELMPSPRKRRARAHTAMSLDEFGVNHVSTDDHPIEIYTDSKDRIPDIDPDEDNPFYVKKKDPSAEGGPTTEAAPKSPHVIVNPELAKALKREDGMVFVFRGRKIFCKFDRNAQEDGDQDDDEEDEDALDALEIPPPRPAPFTRSSYKPRILFPTEEQKREREMRDAAAEDVLMRDHDDDPLSDIDEDALNMPASAFAHPPDEDEHTAVAEMTTTTTTTTTRVNRSFTKEAMARVPGDRTPPRTPVAPDFSPITPAFPNVDVLAVDDRSGPVTPSHTKKTSDATVTANMDDDDPSSAMTVPAPTNPKQKTGPFDDWTRAKPQPKPAAGSPKSMTSKTKTAKSKIPKVADKLDKGKKRTGGGEGAVEGPVSKRTRSWGKKNQRQGPSKAKAKKSKPKKH